MSSLRVSRVGRLAPIAAALVVLMSGGRAFAEPVVLGVSGDVFADDSLVITGLDFGSKDPAAPVLWDRLTNQESYASLADGDEIPTQSDGCQDCPWEAPNYWGNPVVFSQDDPRTPGGATYRTIAKGYLKFHELGGETPDYIYVNWWFRTSVNFEEGGSNKLIRVWRDESGEDGRVSWTQMHMTSSGAETSWENWGGSANTWANMELEVDGRGDIQNGGGVIRARTDGVLIHDTTYEAPQPLNYIDLIGLDASEEDRTAGYVFDWTDVYVDTTPARVIISNSPDLAAGTPVEIQIPVEWGQQQIVVSTNSGNLNASQDLYLFVFDELGARSQAGFLIDGSGGVDDPPSAPGVPSMEQTTD